MGKNGMIWGCVGTSWEHPCKTGGTGIEQKYHTSILRTRTRAGSGVVLNDTLQVLYCGRRQKTLPPAVGMSQSHAPTRPWRLKFGPWRHFWFRMQTQEVYVLRLPHTSVKTQMLLRRRYLQASAGSTFRGAPKEQEESCFGRKHDGLGAVGERKEMPWLTLSQSSLMNSSPWTQVATGSGR